MWCFLVFSATVSVIYPPNVCNDVDRRMDSGGCKRHLSAASLLTIIQKRGDDPGR